jgi:hypothetical protein
MVPRTPELLQDPLTMRADNSKHFHRIDLRIEIGAKTFTPLATFSEACGYFCIDSSAESSLQTSHRRGDQLVGVFAKLTVEVRVLMGVKPALKG